MPLNTLFAHCLLPGRTAYAEQKSNKQDTGIRVPPQSGEAVLLFNIDDQTNPSCRLRSALNIQGGLCDCLVLYKGSEGRPVLCLVELKGSDVASAAEQLANTQRALLGALKRRKEQESFRFRGYIRTRGSSHTGIDRTTKRKLQDAFGAGEFKVAKEGDLGSFLRDNGQRTGRKKRKKAKR